ncbi:ABC transporter permease subunit [Proteinivorax tanatarense]|uniref:ABC transporter permease subunit n=1 Tax=Proteinivorax tanatarense TaxID=1260629 RepID=A0AAU7VJZ7_9FIRM
MLTMIKFEVKKLLNRPIVLVLLLLILSVNYVAIFINSEGGLVQQQDLEMTRREQGKYAGDINEEWTNYIQSTLYSVRENPSNLLSKKEKEQVRNEYLERGYSRQYVDNLENTAFLKPEILNSHQYIALLDAEYASGFYDNAQFFSDMQGKHYRLAYTGNKGESLAAKAEEMYGNLANDYTAYYDYNLGWQKLINMQNLMPYTIGLFLIVALSPIFSGEYYQKTDSILLTTKYGKSKLIYGKILAAFLVGLGCWLLINFLNLLLISLIFTLQGGQSFVQDWVFNFSPFAFTQRTHFLAVSFISLTGVMLFISVPTFISVKSKSPFVTLTISSIVLLLSNIISSFEIDGLIGGIIREGLFFLPAWILVGSGHLQNFNAYYIAGNVVLMQLVVPFVAILVSIYLIFNVYNTFLKREVEN